MSIKKGQGLFFKLEKFANGAICEKARPFLVIDIIENSNIIQVLNISSARGKEARLAYDSNLIIRKYKPPFKEPSFVKLDELYEIEYDSNLKILYNGVPIDEDEYMRIINKFNDYKKVKEVKVLRCSAETLQALIINNLNSEIS